MLKVTWMGKKRWDRLALPVLATAILTAQTGATVVVGATVADRATFQKPLAIAVGIRKVMVNGKLVWDAGKVTGAMPGAVLR